MRQGIYTQQSIFFYIIVVLISLNLLFGLLPAPLFDEDEGFTAEAAREMLVNQDFITISVHNEPRYDKPPLAFWCIALSLKLFGLSEWAVRLPSMLFSLALCVFIYKFVKKYFDKQLSEFTLILLTGTLQLSLMSKAAIADPFLYFFLVACMFNLWEFIEQKTPKNLYFASIFAGLGFLTKGPISLLIPAVVLFVYAIRYQKRKLFLQILNWKAVLLFPTIVSPWFYFAYQKVGFLVFDEFFLKHNLGRFSSSMEGHHGAIWYYVPVLIFGMLPFSPLILKTIVRLNFSKPQYFFLSMWFMFVFVFFSLSATKLPHYVVLGYFPLLILSAKNLQKVQLKWYIIISIVFVLLLFLTPMIAVYFVDNIKDIYAQELIKTFSNVFDYQYYTLQIVYFLGLVSLLVLNKKSNLRWFFIVFFSLSINTTFYYYSQAQQLPIKKIAVKLDKEVILTNHYLPSLSFYAQKTFQIRALKKGDFSVGKITDYKNYQTKILYSKGGIVWVEIL